MAIASEDVRRIHERLDDLMRGVGDLKTALASSDASHVDCRKVVMGNGKDGVAVRLTRLEERDETRQRIVARALAVGAILATVGGAGVQALIKIIFRC